MFKESPPIAERSKPLPITARCLSPLPAQVRILLKACEEVASDLGLGVGLPLVLSSNTHNRFQIRSSRLMKFMLKPEVISYSE